MTATTAATAEGDPRQRTYTWGDPLVAASAAADSSGWDILSGLVNGKIPAPPIAATLGMVPIELQPGRVVFGLQPNEWHYNPIGSVHGGVHATLLDSAMGCAVQTKLAAGHAYTTLEISIRYLRPVTVDTGALRCVGEVVSFGRRVSTARGEITDRSGKLVATGTTTCLLFRLPPPIVPVP
ncbi:MAG: PaaI family thioesterase [Acidimicrobiales bacterium]